MTTLVLDSEALSLLTPERRGDPQRRTLLARFEGATDVVVPRAVRVEAMVPRDAVHADVNRLALDAEDHPRLRSLGGLVADRAASVRSVVGPGTSVVDAVVGATAASLAPDPVEILTSDPSDLSTVVEHLGVAVAVIPV